MATYNEAHLTKLAAFKAFAEKIKAEYATKSEYSALENKVDGLVTAGGEPNVLEGVKVNGVALDIANKIVNILIATGTDDGTIAVAGVDVAVKGLAALAYKAEISEAELSAALKAVIDAKAEQTSVNALTSTVNSLIGEDVGKSARTIASEELAKQLIPENADDALDTLTEIAEWIQKHPDDAATMNAAINSLTSLVGTLPKEASSSTVVEYIAEAIAAIGIGDYAKTAEVTSAISTALADYYTKQEIDGMIATDEEVQAMLDEIFPGEG